MARMIALAVVLGLAVPSSAAPLSQLTMRVQAIRVSDDDGRRPAPTSPRQMQEWVDFANRAFSCAGIRFEFEPESDFSELHSAIINDMTGTQDANWVQAKRLANSIAARFPGKLVVFSRYGPGPNPTGGGFSWWDYNFVVMPGFAAAGHCGHPHTDAFAHEAGHYLGLPHTFAGSPFRTIEEADGYFRRNRSNPNVFDGDGLSDTPPDPSITPLECAVVSEVTLDGVAFTLPRENLMSYYDERRTLSPLQVQRVRWMLKKRLEGAGSLPENTGATRPIEAESLAVIRQAGGQTSVQPMDGFGKGNWSGGAQLFWASTPGASLVLEMPVHEAGRYWIDVYGTLAPDYGTVQVLLDGARIGQPWDGYAPVVLASGRLRLASVHLDAGRHELRLQVVGRNAASSGHLFGLDCIDLAPATQ